MLASCAHVPPAEPDTAAAAGPATPLPTEDGKAADTPDTPPEAPGAVHDQLNLEGSVWLAQTRVEGAPATALWEHQKFANRRPTHYGATTHLGRAAILANADRSNSTLSLTLPPESAIRPVTIRFSWFVPKLNPAFDLKDKAKDDAVARVILSFEGDRKKTWTARDHMLSEMSSLLVGKPLPYATIMYVWSNRYPVGTVIPNAHTKRIRQIVVETGPRHLNRWVDIERDVAADFRLAFGEEPGPLHGVGLMTDSNNVRGKAKAWYGPLVITSAQ